MPHVLLVDDDSPTVDALSELIEGEGFTASVASSLRDGRTELLRRRPDALLVDLVLPDGSGLELIEELEADSAVDVVVITANACIDSVVRALRLGAVDYLTKPLDVPRLKVILANIARAQELKAEIGSLRGELRRLGRFGGLLGTSPPMQKIYDLISRVAPTDATVLLTGESGTGKDLAAQTVHQLSKRRKAIFLPLNCGAISPNLIESELFGHERGSFTGADRTHKGYFERAGGGTIFLDEITEMPIELQVKLLRVLETSHVNRIGGDQQIPVDVRVIAATNRSPDEAVTAGKLREDLLYRLRVFPIAMPPLRDRGEDITFLAEHFLESIGKSEGARKRLTPGALARLKGHVWPGNVRELKNVIHRAFIMAEDDLTAECLSDLVGPEPEDEGAPRVSDPSVPSASRGMRSLEDSGLRFSVGVSLEDVERRMIIATLEKCRGSRKNAAATLGISLKTLYNRLKSYKLQMVEDDGTAQVDATA